MTLKQVIAMTFSYYYRGQVCADDLVEMYAGDLADLDPQVCIQAYHSWRRNPANKQFPLPAQIREIINPQDYIAPEALAKEIAARVVGAVSRFGWNNPKDAEAFIGPDGWAAVQRSGGWANLCENLGVTIMPTTFQAQIRDQIETNLKYGTDVINHAVSLPEKQRKHGGLGLSPASDVVKKITGDFDPDPKGAA